VINYHPRIIDTNMNTLAEESGMKLELKDDSESNLLSYLGCAADNRQSLCPQTTQSGLLRQRPHSSGLADSCGRIGMSLS